jgi:hypothetical protein
MDVGRGGIRAKGDQRGSESAGSRWRGGASRHAAWFRWAVVAIRVRLARPWRHARSPRQQLQGRQDAQSCGILVSAVVVTRRRRARSKGPSREVRI